MGGFFIHGVFHTICVLHVTCPQQGAADAWTSESDGWHFGDDYSSSLVLHVTDLVAMFLPDQIPAQLAPLVVVFGVGFIALAVPWRIWRNLPAWFRREDTWQ